MDDGFESFLGEFERECRSFDVAVAIDDERPVFNASVSFELAVKVADGVFEATTLLTKCGSRYEAAPEDLAR